KSGDAAKSRYTVLFDDDVSSQEATPSESKVSSEAVTGCHREGQQGVVSGDEGVSSQETPLLEDSLSDQGRALRASCAREPAGWLNWWAEYPHKVGEPAAKAAYLSALARASPTDLLEGMRRYVAATKSSDRQWLNP